MNTYPVCRSDKGEGIVKTIYDNSYRKLVHTLRDARLHKRLTQQQIAEKIGKRRAWLGKVEQCEIRLDVLHLIRFAKAVGLRANKLVAEIEEASEEDASFLRIGMVYQSQ